MSSGGMDETRTNDDVDDSGTPPATDDVRTKSDVEDGDARNLEDDRPQRQHVDDDERETHCGIGSCRPACLQPLANIWVFTAAMCFVSCFGSANFAYYVSVITQIERCFGLSSQTTGFIKNVDNIGFMLTVLAVSHLGRYGNKPRILAVAFFLSGIAIFIFAVPHFIYGGPGTSSHLDESSSAAAVWNASSAVDDVGRYEVCDGVDESLEDPSGCASHTRLLDFNAGAMALFVISELLQGMANSPKPTMSLTYVDDNARQRSPIYFGK